jgi:hypothetical protein
MDIGLGRLSERLVLLRDARINEIDVFFDLSRDHPAPPPSWESPVAETGAPGPKPWYDRWVPNDFRLTGLEVGHSRVRLGLKDGEIIFRDTAWSVKPGQVHGAYTATGRGGELDFPWAIVPELRLGEARMRYQDKAMFLLGSDFGLYERGYATLSGEASSDGYAFTGKLDDVLAGEILPEDWSQRVSGRIAADFTVAKVRGGPSVGGSLRMYDGVLTALPVLDALGAYGGDPRFRRLTLSEASLDYLWEDGALTISNLKLGSEGLMRVEGRLRVEADERIDGRFRVGLTPGTLARIPGAETKVFVPGERGLLWTDVRVTGTVDDPREDLSERLILAAGLRMFEVLPETGEKVLKYTNRVVDPEVVGRLTGENGLIDQGRGLIESGKGLLDGEGDLLDKAGETLRQGTDVVRGVEEIFGFFEDRKKEPPPEPPAPPREPQ